MAERLLGNMKVGDMHKIIVEKASTLSENTPLDDLFDKIVEDPRTRHVYVVDENNILIGSISLNSILRYLFPLTAMSSLGEISLLDTFSSMVAVGVKDIMNAKPAYVSEDATVIEAVEMMIAEGVNELPVVDKDRRVVGEINFLEIIAAYLKTKRGN